MEVRTTSFYSVHFLSMSPLGIDVGGLCFTHDGSYVQGDTNKKALGKRYLLPLEDCQSLGVTFS